MNQQGWMKVHQKRLLDNGKIENLVLSLRSMESTNADVLERIRTDADYFERNGERMRYPKFRRQRLNVGSGVIEAGCKTVIGCRLKRSVCSGLSAVATRSSPSATATSTADSRTTGNRAAAASDFQFHVAHPRR